MKQDRFVIDPDDGGVDKYVSRTPSTIAFFLGLFVLFILPVLLEG